MPKRALSADAIPDKRVALLMGGTSREREVSLRSGERAFAALERLGFETERFDVAPDFPRDIVKRGFRTVFIALHGRPGEDGVVQGALELAGLRYTCARVAGSAVSMDKALTKRLVSTVGVSTLETVFPGADFDPARARYPLIAKPRCEGSSIGARVFDGPEGLADFLREGEERFGRYIVEPFVEGKSVTVGVLGGGERAYALPSLELQTLQRRFYDYDSKYTEGMTRFVVPAEVEPAARAILKETALRVHRLLDLRGTSRSDFVVGPAGEVYFLEVNTIPGLTTLSDVPVAAEAVGIDYDEVILEILASAFE